MKTLKLLLELPSLILSIFYVTYIFIRVIGETGIVELGTMNSNEIAEEVIKIFKTFYEKNETFLHIFNGLTWMTFLIYNI
jgi:hypothetical protein